MKLERVFFTRYRRRLLLRFIVQFGLGVFLLAVVDIALSLTPFESAYVRYHVFSSIVFLVWVVITTSVFCWWVYYHMTHY